MNNCGHWFIRIDHFKRNNGQSYRIRLFSIRKWDLCCNEIFSCRPHYWKCCYSNLVIKLLFKFECFFFRILVRIPFSSTENNQETMYFKLFVAILAFNIIALYAGLSVLSSHIYISHNYFIMAQGSRCARCVRHDLEPNIFPSDHLVNIWVPGIFFLAPSFDRLPNDTLERIKDRLPSNTLERIKAAKREYKQVKRLTMITFMFRNHVKSGKRAVLIINYWLV